MTISIPITLTGADILHERPFTHPDHSRADSSAIHHMRATLRHLLNTPNTLPERPFPLMLYLPETGGRKQRVILMNFDDLRAADDVMLVGFFGHKKPLVDSLALEAMDIELITEFMHHPNVLSYSSLELPHGDWCNLVLLNAPEGIQSWNEGKKHAYAVRNLAPQHYEYIRLHNGIIPGGVLSEREPRLTRTKYYAFEGDAWWYAVREGQTA